MRYNQLNQMTAKSLGVGKHLDGLGLYLVKRRKETGKWILRLPPNDSQKRREMGLGRWPEVSIAEAREQAGKARTRWRNGEDPIETRQQQRRSSRGLSVAEAIDGCFVARQAELKNDGKAGRWLSPLSVHIIPKIGKRPIEQIDQHILKQVLEPIWHTKAEVATKALSRMNLTLKHAAALGLEVDLQAVAKTKALLGKQRHVVQHIPSLAYSDVPKFYSWLTGVPGPTALALRLLILTATRTSEIRFASVEEIDGNIWTLPKERTKTGREHRVPLTDEALSVVAAARDIAVNEYLFSSYRGKPMSDMAMSKFMGRHNYEARPHGFRSSFRSWSEECTDAPFEVKEAVLGHAVDKGVVKAYQRSDRLEKRRLLLNSWTGFIVGSF